MLQGMLRGTEWWRESGRQQGKLRWPSDSGRGRREVHTEKFNEKRPNFVEELRFSYIIYSHPTEMIYHKVESNSFDTQSIK